MVVESKSCPNCGAPIQSQGTEIIQTCPYCGSSQITGEMVSASVERFERISSLSKNPRAKLLEERYKALYQERKRVEEEERIVLEKYVHERLEALKKGPKTPAVAKGCNFIAGALAALLLISGIFFVFISFSDSSNMPEGCYLSIGSIVLGVVFLFINSSVGKHQWKSLNKKQEPIETRYKERRDKTEQQYELKFNQIDDEIAQVKQELKSLGVFSE